ncbi:MAG TPA: hypothetical protein PLA94_32310 [Myxococcota bacterium]|jgi:hypothetical protein|nr:hypothetical protein [Myxococcota bacterium]
MFLLCILTALAETRWTTEAVEGVRWLDSTTVTLKLEANAEVELLAVEGGKARVVADAKFGWIDAAKLTDVAPPKPMDPAEGMPGGMPPGMPMRLPGQ